MATENGHDHPHSKMSMPDGNLAGFDTIDALFQVIYQAPPHKTFGPRQAEHVMHLWCSLCAL